MEGEGGEESTGRGAELEVEVEKVQVCRWGGIGQNPRADWSSGAGELPSVKTATLRDRAFCGPRSLYFFMEIVFLILLQVFWT